MCTLSIFKSTDGYRLFMNRDERHERADGLSPRIVSTEHGIMAPVDPVSDGTWIGYNARGYWACLLNGYLDEDLTNTSRKKSRGGIIPYILEQDDPIAAAAALETLGYPSFRLVVGSLEEHRVFRWDGGAYLEVQPDAAVGNMFFLSSSSWQPRETLGIRKDLFLEWAARHPDYDGSVVPEFHYSQEPCAESAPLMSRSYSRTRSITVMGVQAHDHSMEYWQMPHDLVQLKKRAA